MTPTAFAPFFKLLRHVVRDVEGALGVVRQRRRQHVVADLLAVEVELAQAQAADVGRRAPDLLLDRELPAQHPRRPTGGPPAR